MRVSCAKWQAARKVNALDVELVPLVRNDDRKLKSTLEVSRGARKQK